MLLLEFCRRKEGRFDYRTAARLQLLPEEAGLLLDVKDDEEVGGHPSTTAASGPYGPALTSTTPSQVSVKRSASTVPGRNQVDKELRVRPTPAGGGCPLHLQTHIRACVQGRACPALRAR
jgi:hypothetical protein